MVALFICTCCLCCCTFGISYRYYANDVKLSVWNSICMQRFSELSAGKASSFGKLYRDSIAPVHQAPELALYNAPCIRHGCSTLIYHMISIWWITAAMVTRKCRGTSLLHRKEACSHWKEWQINLNAPILYIFCTLFSFYLLFLSDSVMHSICKEYVWMYVYIYIYMCVTHIHKYIIYKYTYDHE